MKLSVNAIICLQLLYCLVFVGIIHVCGSSLSWYGTVNNSTMGYSRDQLISMRDGFTNGSSSFVSVLKKNGIFKYEGPRGCRAGRCVKQKVYKIPTLNSTYDKQPVLTQCPSRSSVAQCNGSLKDNLIIVKPEKSLHSEKKGYRNSAPGVLLLQIVPFFWRGTFFSLIIMFIRKRVPLSKRVLFSKKCP